MAARRTFSTSAFSGARAADITVVEVVEIATASPVIWHYRLCAIVARSRNTSRCGGWLAPSSRASARSIALSTSISCTSSVARSWWSGPETGARRPGTDRDGEHSVEAQRHALEHYVDARGIAFGAFVGGRLVGIGVVVPHVRPAVAQLAFLHVTQTLRAAGIGSRLSGELEHVARDAGDSAMVVTATPSANTVRFYLGRGYELMAQPLPELFEREPEDVHMRKVL